MPEIVRIVICQAVKLRRDGALTAAAFEDKLTRLCREELDPRGLRLLVRELPDGQTRILIKEARDGRVCEMIDCTAEVPSYPRSKARTGNQRGLRFRARRSGPGMRPCGSFLGMKFNRRFLKRTALVLLGLLVLLAIFHRPILFRLTRYFIIRSAEKQHLALTYEMSGSIFTNLKVTNLKGTPTEPGPVERLEIGSLRLEYSLWGLVRKGLPGLLESVALADAHIVLDPTKSLPPEKAQKPQSVKFPALIPERLSIENLNVTVRQPGGNFVLADFDLLLHPQREGWLRAGRIAIPGFRTWTGLDAAATYAERNLVLRGFALSPEVQVARLSLDMSRLTEDALGFGFDSTLFGGAAGGSVLPAPKRAARLDS